jgi:sec-independent protein translocase protein TatB
MFDIGFQELVIIFVVALIVFGPKRLPEIGRTLGKGLGELKRAMDNVRDQIHEEVKEIKPSVDPLELKNRLYSALDPSSEDKTVAEGPKEVEKSETHKGEQKTP